MYNLKVLVADDHSLFRKGLIAALEQTCFGNSTVLQAVNGIEAIDQVLEHQPDIIFMDISMPVLNGYDASKRILGLRPDTRIIAITTFDEMPLILNLFRVGVKAFLNKNIEPEHLEESIRAVLIGDYYYHSRYDQQIARWLKDDLKKSVPYIEFTPREVDLVLLIAKGKTSSEIAAILELSARSVDTYRLALMAKVGVTNTSELVSFTFKTGIVP